MSHSDPSRLIIASRASKLAMWQAEHVQSLLQRAYPSCAVTILAITTRGDQILDRTLSKVGGKGLFIKELEVAMLEGRADIAVHSLKDVPMELPEEFDLAAVLAREDARDALVSNRYQTLSQLPSGAIIGTSSLRRAALLMHRFPHLVIKPLRGNLNTRLAKLDAGEYDAIILAAAGLIRLGASERIGEAISPLESMPAPGQGAVAIEICKNRPDLKQWLAGLTHLPTQQAVDAERAVSRAFQGGCQLPLAAYATISGNTMQLSAMLATPDGQRTIVARASGEATEGASIASEVVAALKSQDAASILAICLSEP